MARSSATATGLGVPGSIPGASAGGSSGTTQLEFNQAMTDFKVMFPDVDADVIEAVLRANNGAVDATIDNLLAMSADNETEKASSHHAAAMAMDRPPEYPPLHPPSYQQATQDGGEDLINLGGDETPGRKEELDFLSELDSLGAAARPSSSPKHAYSHPQRQEAEEQHAAASFSPPRHQPKPSTASTSIVPTQQMLQDRYEENLRLREEVRANPESATARTQYLEDERLALMMQNEEFLAELRGDRDFLSTLAEEEETPVPHHQGRKYHQQECSSSSGNNSSGRGKSSLMMDEAMFREKLKTMGKTSKRKFTQLAHMFSSRRKGAKQLLGHAPAPSHDNLLLNAEPIVSQEFDEDSEDSEKEEQKKTPTKGKYTSFS